MSHVHPCHTHPQVVAQTLRRHEQLQMAARQAQHEEDASRAVHRQVQQLYGHLGLSSVFQCGGEELMDGATWATHQP